MASSRQRFPVFSKPITNLKGMGVGSRVLRDAADYVTHYAPGHMWMTLLEGGMSRPTSRCSTARRCGGGTRPASRGGGHVRPLDRPCGKPTPRSSATAATGSQQHLAGYTGMLNLETIGGRIIEVHLRFADQWPDLYGEGWVEALVRLYQHGRWDYPDTDRRDGYSVVLFGPHGPRYRHPPQALIDEVRAMPCVSSVQITFHENKPADQHAMPPGGFRLAIVNCFDLAAGGARRAKSCARFSGDS